LYGTALHNPENRGIAAHEQLAHYRLRLRNAAATTARSSGDKTCSIFTMTSCVDAFVI
jgi:hypothetical protein